MLNEKTEYYHNFDDLWEFLKEVKGFYSTWVSDSVCDVDEETGVACKKKYNITVLNKRGESGLNLIFEHSVEIENCKNLRQSSFKCIDAIFEVSNAALYCNESFESDEIDKIIYSQLRICLAEDRFEYFISMFLEGLHQLKFETCIQTLRLLYKNVELSLGFKAELIESIADPGNGEIFNRILAEKERVSSLNNQISFILNKCEMLVFCELIDKKLEEKLLLRKKKKEDSDEN